MGADWVSTGVTDVLMETLMRLHQITLDVSTIVNMKRADSDDMCEWGKLGRHSRGDCVVRRGEWPRGCVRARRKRERGPLCILVLRTRLTERRG